jgi:hypothetical protein
MMKRMRWKLRRYLTRHLAPGPISLAMAWHLGRVAGASFLYCGHCERPLTAVVVAEAEDGSLADVIALGCTTCGYRTEVRAGILSSATRYPDYPVGEAAD